jgi:hypothetical protein
MIIRKYGDMPVTYAPDVGEVVMARRSPVAKFVKAVVLKAQRRGDGQLRVKVQWLGSDPAPATTEATVNPIVEGTTGIVIHPLDGRPPMIKQIARGQASN